MTDIHRWLCKIFGKTIITFKVTMYFVCRVFRVHNMNEACCRSIIDNINYIIGVYVSKNSKITCLLTN